MSSNTLQTAEENRSAIELRGISKRFGEVQANRDVSLAVRRGEIHGIIGENGAGKSTLMSIIYGFYEADSGAILVNGEERVIRTPSDAIKAGIGMVHQHFMLVEPLTVTENVLLGAEEGAVITKSRRSVKAALQTLEREYKLHVPADELVRNLPVGVRQRVEIIKALYRKAEILILDEPTGVLTPSEAENLFRLLASLRDQGRTIILITHKLKEIMAITDAVTVMRQGAVVGSVHTADTDPDELAAMMVGRRVGRTARAGDSTPGDVLLEAKNLTLVDRLGVKRLDDVSLNVRAGEIVGIAGVSGNGQTELLAVLSGMQAQTSGDIEVAGKSVASFPHVNARTMRTMGVGHIPEDRQREGIVTKFEASESAILGFHDDPSFNGRILSNRGRIVAHSKSLMKTYDVRPNNPFLKSANFSGGNQQKLIVGREVERDPQVLLVGQPTRGVDIGAIEQIHRRLADLRKSGKAILLVSVELDELLALADRILVMFSGAVVGEVKGTEADEKTLGLMMAGMRPH